MDERELVGLLYRADWTRLALTGTVRGAGQFPPTTPAGAPWPASEGLKFEAFPPRDPSRWGPPDWLRVTAEGALDESSLLVAPGKRYRLERTDRSRVLGCDGTRVWQWFADVPPDAAVKFERQPCPPVPDLLVPNWLLTRYRLTIEGETTLVGRRAIAVTGTARGGRRNLLSAEALSAGRTPRAGHVTAVIDAELGIVLRRELRSGPDGEHADVAEFLSLEVADAADLGASAATAFTPPDGSFFGDGDGDGADPNPLQKAGLEAAKLIGGLAAGGLGAAIKYGPKRQADPFATATAEDPDDAMPQDEQLGAEAGGAGEPAPVSEEVLSLLYRGGLELAPFSGTLHEWIDLGVVGGMLLDVVPESARRAGFGGVGFLLDTIMAEENWSTADHGHQVYRVRVGGWDRYRIDRVSPRPPRATSRLGRPKSGGPAVTIACDGERTFRVFADEVRAGPATTLDTWHFADLAGLVDGGWLLGFGLADGGVVELDGRTGYRVIVTEGAEPPVRPPLSWVPTWWLPAVAVIDASSGRLLRLTRFRDGAAAVRLEFRSVADGGSDDFAFTPPDGLRVVDEPERWRWFEDDDDDDESDESEGPAFHGPDGRPTTPPEAVQAVVDAVKEQVDLTMAAAREFLGSFLGGRR
jgi:hypothetical protein